jgi:transposase
MLHQSRNRSHSFSSVGDGRQFQSARHFAAWLGLTPRVHASGGKEHIGRISKGGDRYLRALLIRGARAIVGTSFRKDVPPRPWLKQLLARTSTSLSSMNPPSFGHFCRS